MKNENDHDFVTRMERRAASSTEPKVSLHVTEYARLHGGPWMRFSVGVYEVKPNEVLQLCEEFKLRNVIKKLE